MPSVFFRPSSLFLRVIVLVSLAFHTLPAQDRSRALGELIITIHNPPLQPLITVEAASAVHGSRIDWFPLVNRWDSYEERDPFYVCPHVDRDGGATGDTIGYAEYLVTCAQGYGVYIDYRDADYCDFDTARYRYTDFNVHFDVSIQAWWYVADGDSHALSNYQSVKIWDVWHKQTSPRIPVTVTNSFGSGTVGVNNVTGNAPYQTRWPVNGDSIPIAAISSQTYQGLIHEFASWSDGGNQNHSVRPSLGNFGYQLTAVFDTSAPVRISNLQIGGDNGDPVHLSWDVHTNDSVDYYVYRIIRHNGVNGDPVLLTTLPHSANSYDDPDYVVAGSSSDRLYYDVRAHHTPSNTFAQSYWDGGILGVIQSRERPEFGDSVIVQKQDPTEYSLDVYPNPFNPTTMIRYGLPQRAVVSLRVFDALGREVRVLVDEERSAGVHEVRFDAVGLASGMYIYRLQAHPVGTGEGTRSNAGRDGDYVAVKRLLIVR
jgi:hypothetical protein